MMLFAPSHGGGPYDTFKAWIILSLQLLCALPKSVQQLSKGNEEPRDNTAVHDFGLLRAFVSSTHAQWKGKLPVHRNLQENRKCQR